MNNGKWLTRQEAEMIKRQYPAGTRLLALIVGIDRFHRE